eukprot:2536536-Rhodomonas_salina.5
MPDYNDNLIFQYIVVAMAIEHGARQSLPERDDPLLNANNCTANYHYIIRAIAGFSAQLASKCSGAFPNIFKRPLQCSIH